jgi:hypothetical protein
MAWGVLVALQPAAGDAATPSSDKVPARLECTPAQGPGRVRCTVEARVGPGETIQWGDVLLVAAPPFVSPLRGRIGPHDATVRDPGAWQWAFALVARGTGRGVIDGRVRLVVCGGKRPTCDPIVAPVSGEIAVGQ